MGAGRSCSGGGTKLGRPTSWLVTLLRAEEDPSDAHGRRGQDLAPATLPGHRAPAALGSSHPSTTPLQLQVRGTRLSLECSLRSNSDGSSLSACAFSANVTSSQGHPWP